MKITDLSLSTIFDSRGETTIEVALQNSTGWYRAGVPSGKSRGSGEAFVVPPEKAGKVLDSIKKKLIKKSFPSITALDNELLALDGTENKRHLGGNLMLGISIAFAKAAAGEKEVPLWQVLKKEFFPKQPAAASSPLIFSNLINGGLHARNNLAFQEYMVVVKKNGTYERTIVELIAFYRMLGEALQKEYKTANIPIGDEGGYALDFRNNLEPLAILQDLIQKNHLNSRFGIAIDAAASDFMADGSYHVDGSSFSTIQLAALYHDYLKKITGIVSIEDPFGEKDFEGFKMLRKLSPKTTVVGDDLTVTSPERITRFANEKLITGVIIKPNQIGTVSETCAAIAAAQKNKVKTIISHRSGEVEDAFVIQFARAANAWAVKIGAPVKERLIKFNELIRVYDR